MKKSLTRLPNKPKSSPDARRLLEAVYKQEGSWQKVSDRLGLSNKGAAWQMSKGTLHDTPEMRVALRYARRRERMAFAGLRLPKEPIDMRRELIQEAAKDVRRALAKLNSLTTPTEESNDTHPVTEAGSDQ